MPEDELFDAIVVGAGATGGPAAEHLARGGMRVLVLEAGPRHDAPPAPDGLAKKQHVQERCLSYDDTTRHLFVDDDENPYSTPDGKPFLWIRSRGVGGRLALWGGVVPRMEERDLRAATRDGFGSDWPLGYDDLAPYYAKAEAVLGADLAAGSSRVPTAAAADFQRAIAAAFPDRKVELAPMVWTHLRTPTEIVDRAVLTGNVRVVANAVAKTVLVDASGKARGVAWVDATTGRERESTARAVVVCASTIESVRLLLNSASAKHPGGLGASSGVLGRFLMDHLHASISGIVPAHSGYVDDPAAGLGGHVYVPCFRNVGERAAFLRGYGIQGYVGPWMTADTVRDMPGDFASNRAMVLEQNVPARFALKAFGEVLAREDNFVALDPVLRDRWGIPAPHVHFTYSENEAAIGRDMIAALRAMAEAAGFVTLEDATEPLLPGLSVHELGGARMGSDRATSVLDPFGEVWDAQNVFVGDGASFVSGGCQNPTLTMVALALRACDRLLDRFRRSAL